MGLGCKGTGVRVVMAQRLQFLFPRPPFPTASNPTMARQLQTTRTPDGAPARAPAYRAAATAQVPDAATARRFPRAPGVRGEKEPVAPVLVPCLHVRDLPLRWYGIGGTG